MTVAYMMFIKPLTNNALAEVDIVFNAGPISAAKFRRAASSFDLIITASVACSNGAGQPALTPTATNAQNAANPTQASLCSSAAIETTDTAEWFNYGVSSPISSRRRELTHLG